MLSAKVKVSSKLDQKGRKIFEFSEVKKVKKDDFKKEKRKLEALQEFLKEVQKVNINKLR